MTVEVRLDDITCVRQQEGSPDEVYMWTMMFRVDGESFRQSQPGGPITGSAASVFNLSSQGNLGGGLVQGETRAIPYDMGAWRTTLTPLTLELFGQTVRFDGAVIAIAVLLEKDASRDGLVQAGRRAAYRFARDKINAFVRSIDVMTLPARVADALGVSVPQLATMDAGDISKAAEALFLGDLNSQLAAIRNEAKTVITAAIKDEAGFLDFPSLIDADDELGVYTGMFLGNELMREAVAGRFSRSDVHRFAINGEPLVDPLDGLGGGGTPFQRGSEYPAYDMRVTATVLPTQFAAVARESERDTSEVRAFTDQTVADLYASGRPLANAGWRPIDIQAYAIGGTTLFSTVWVHRAGPLWRLMFDMDSDGWQRAFDGASKEGFATTHLAGYTRTESPRDGLLLQPGSGGALPEGYAAILEQTVDTPARRISHGLTGAQLQAQFESNPKAGYRPVRITGYLSGEETRFTSIWEHREGPDWWARFGMSHDEYQAEVDATGRSGFAPHYVNTHVENGHLRINAIFEHGQGAWQARHRQTFSGIRAFAASLPPNLRLACLSPALARYPAPVGPTLQAQGHDTRAMSIESGRFGTGFVLLAQGTSTRSHADVRDNSPAETA